MHVLGGIGLALLVLGMLGLGFLALVWLNPENRPIGNRPLLVYSATLLGVGTQLLCLGILAELVTAYNIRPDHLYSVSERIGPNESGPITAPPTTRPSDHERTHHDQPRLHHAIVDARTSADFRTHRRPDPHRHRRRPGPWLHPPLPRPVWRQRYLPLVHRLEPRRTGHLRHRRLPVADQHPGQGPAPRPVPDRQPEGEEPVEHTYSSKPPFLPTLIAGLVYPFRVITGVPLEAETPQARLPRYVPKKADDGTITYSLETPEKPVIWPVHVFYFEPILILLNIVPLIFLLVLYTRLLDRYAPHDWSWFISLCAAGFGVLTFPFLQSLNNHSVAAYAAFFALYGLIRAYESDDAPPGYYALAGFSGAFCACNELPAALFGIALFIALLVRSPRKTLLAFVPAAAIPCAFFLATQYLAFGQIRPVYEEFGTKSYKYEGSYWNTPLEMDWFNEHPESQATYLFHMTFGHHGVFSLTPIFLFSIYGASRLVARRGPLRPTAILTLLLTLAMIAFYTWNPKARNYGGSTAGLRWLFWLIPFWLITLPEGLRGIAQRRGLRTLALAALGISVLSVGYAIRNPWGHPWLLDAIEHLGLYTLPR